MIIDFIKQPGVKVSQSITPYQEDSLYWGFLDENQQLINLFSFQYDIEIEPCELGRPFKLGYISEEAFEVMKRSLLSNSVLCYIDEKHQEIIYYRFVITVNKTSETSIQIVVDFLDEHDQPTNLNEIKLKSAKLPTKQNRPRLCDISTIDDNIFDVHFLDPGDYNLKISGFHQNTKVKAYIPWSI